MYPITWQSKLRIYPTEINVLMCKFEYIRIFCCIVAKEQSKLGCLSIRNWQNDVHPLTMGNFLVLFKI